MFVTENQSDWCHSEIHFALELFFPYHQLGNIDPPKVKEALVELVITEIYYYNGNMFICYQ